MAHRLGTLFWMSMLIIEMPMLIIGMIVIYFVVLIIGKLYLSPGPWLLQVHLHVLVLLNKPFRNGNVKINRYKTSIFDVFSHI